MSCVNKVRKLARTLCASFEGPDGCIGTPLSRPDCVYFRHDLIKYRCKYFESHVLPSDPALKFEYHSQIENQKAPEPPKNIAHCESCDKSFKRTSNRQKYCPPCGEEAQKEATRKRVKRHQESEKNKRLF